MGKTWVKVTGYTARAVAGTGRAAANASYVTRQHEGELRTGFDREGEDITRRELYQAIEEAEGKYDSRMVLAPDPGQTWRWDEPDWQRYTRETLSVLQERHPNAEWVGVAHQDPEHPHVHVWLNTDKTLNHADLRELRTASFEAAQELCQERGFYLSLEAREATHAERREIEQSLSQEPEVGPNPFGTAYEDQQAELRAEHQQQHQHQVTPDLDHGMEM